MTELISQERALPAEPRLALTVVSCADNRRFAVEVPATITPAELAENLVAQGYFAALPARQHYQFCIEGGHQLDDDQPFSATGVSSGAVVQAVTTALGACVPVPSAVAEGEGATSPPAWLRHLHALHAARAGHFFILHLNVDDYVFDGTRFPRRLIGYLAEHLRVLGHGQIALLSVSNGLGWAGDGSGLPTTSDVAEPSAALRALADWLDEAAPRKVAILIEHLDHVAPAGGRDRETLKAAELLLLLAQDERLRASGSLIVGLCANLDSVSAPVLEGTGTAIPVTVPLPDATQRARFLEYLATPPGTAAALEPGLTRAGLAHLTQGLTLAALDGLERRARQTGQALTRETVRGAKRLALEQQSGGILRDMDARHGFEAVGGLEHVVAYLRGVIEALRSGRVAGVPKAILFTGPPGTGKTLVAQALAKEAGFNLVRLGDVRSMWVGESERNLSRALRLLVELAPVVVFVDEIDQMVGGRDVGRSGDSGVSARLFGRLLNFMGDEGHRGRVMWVGATNRPDLLDDAMLRRFDRAVPFFLPGPRQRAEILRALPRLTAAAYADGVALDDVVQATAGLTGSAIELVVRRAGELAGAAPMTAQHLLHAIEDYKPNHDPAEYLRQSLLALRATNLYSMLPPCGELPPDVADVVAAMRREASAAPLVRRLRALQAGMV